MLFSFVVSCSRRDDDPYSDKAAREALTGQYDSLENATGTKNDVKSLEKMVLSKDPFRAGAALKRASGWDWERSRSVFLEAMKSSLSLVRDQAARYLMEGEANHGAPESSTWYETFEVLLRQVTDGRLSDATVRKFAHLAGTERHDQVRDAIRLSSGPRRLRGMRFLCTMDLTDEDVRFLRRNTAWITDDDVFSLCDGKVRKATFGKKSLTRGVR